MHHCNECGYYGEPLEDRESLLEVWGPTKYRQTPQFTLRCPECDSEEIELTDDREETEEAGEPIEVPRLEDVA